MASQMGAVTNQGIRPNYRAIINAQTPYLPGMYDAKWNRDYNERVLNQTTKQNKISNAMTASQLSDAKKANTVSNAIRVGTLGLSGYQAWDAMGDAPEAANAVVNHAASPAMDEFNSGVSGSGIAKGMMSAGNDLYEGYVDPVVNAVGNVAGAVPGIASEYIAEPLKKAGTYLYDTVSNAVTGLGDIFTDLF